MFLKGKCVLMSAVALLVCFLSMPASAEDTQKQPYKTIKTDELKAVWNSKPKDLLIIDARNPGEYADVHIPGAINMPQKKFDEYTYLLPAEKSTRIVFYCNGFK
jgi:3-mercaptopyruvate sulfurtransferase SseA